VDVSGSTGGSEACECGTAHEMEIREAQRSREETRPRADQPRRRSKTRLGQRTPGRPAAAMGGPRSHRTSVLIERPPRPRLEKPKRRDSLTALYEGLVAAIIRPPRAVYDAQSLGPTSFELEGSVRVLRRDVALRNIRRERLVASHWAVDDAAKRPCVIFCHANSASRVQAVHYLALLLSLGCSVLALDFAGAGLSEGDVVTLGFREADDVAAAVQFLRGDARVSRIAGWGSSAGAAALLFFMATYDAALACCVLDGSYADVRQVAACCGNQPVRRQAIERRRVDGVEDDATISTNAP